MIKKQVSTASRIRHANKRNRIVFSIIISLLILILVACLVYLVWMYRQANDVQEVYEQVIDEVVEEPSDNNDVDKWLRRKINFKKLKHINSDITSWVFIPHTIIDYPVMQEQQLNQYFYLHRNIHKSYSSVGSVFTPKEPENMDDAHMLLFAHRFFYTNVMFSHLQDYKTKSYYDKHKYVYMYYPDHSERWHVWSVTETDETDMVYDIPYTIGSDSYHKLIQHLNQDRLYDTDVTCDKDTRIITLSTCRGNYYGGPYRFTVSCVRDCVYYYDTKEFVSDKEMRNRERVITDDNVSHEIDISSEKDEVDPEIQKWMESVRQKQSKFSLK